MRLLTTSVLLASLFSTTSVVAACYTKYDYSTGNNYQICQNNGNTTVRGSNLRTGSTWNQTQRSNGSYSGQDSSGNFYSGNNNTGFYNNLGTGKTCFGTGAFRTCN